MMSDSETEYDDSIFEDEKSHSEEIDFRIKDSEYEDEYRAWFDSLSDDERKKVIELSPELANPSVGVFELSAGSDYDDGRESKSATDRTDCDPSRFSGIVPVLEAIEKSGDCRRGLAIVLWRLKSPVFTFRYKTENDFVNAIGFDSYAKFDECDKLTACTIASGDATRNGYAHFFEMVWTEENAEMAVVVLLKNLGSDEFKISDRKLKLRFGTTFQTLNQLRNRLGKRLGYRLHEGKGPIGSESYENSNVRKVDLTNDAKTDPVC